MINKKYAGIDLGSNSCKLLIVDEKEKICCIKNTSTRLAEGLQKENKITKEAMDRGLACLFDYKMLLDKYDVEKDNVRAITTAACRMAENGKDFVNKVYDETGIKLEIIDGLEEARLNLKGAISHVIGKSKYVVIYDLGGASTEITLATNENNPKIIHSISIPWGARNASEVFDLVEYKNENAEKLQKDVAKYMDDFLAKSELKKYDDVKFVATSSTALRLASMVKKFGRYNREKADGVVMNRKQIDAAVSEILYDKRKKLAENPYIGDKRSYIFIAACVIFKKIYEKLEVQKLTASLKSAKEGIVKELIERDNLKGKKYAKINKVGEINR